MMTTNIYELIIKTLNKTNITLAEGYMLAKKLEHICEDWNSYTIRVDDECFRIIIYFKADNGDIYYEEEHTVTVFTDGVIGEYKHYKENADDVWTVEIDKQGTIIEFLQNKLVDFTK